MIFIICEVANSIKVAIRWIYTSYDCILLDLMLTVCGSDGFKIWELLKQNKGQKVFIISTKRNPRNQKLKVTLGAEGQVTKPFHLSELLDLGIQALVKLWFNG